jgi:hypothetical protein
VARLARHIDVLAGQRELRLRRVIQPRPCPAVSGVAGSAVGAQPALVDVVLVMAGRAVLGRGAQGGQRRGTVMAAVARGDGRVLACQRVRGVGERAAVGVLAIVAVEAGRAVGIGVGSHLGLVELLVAADAICAGVVARRRDVTLAAADVGRDRRHDVRGQGEAGLVVREQAGIDLGRGGRGPVVVGVAAAARCGRRVQPPVEPRPGRGLLGHVRVAGEAAVAGELRGPECGVAGVAATFQLSVGRHSTKRDWLPAVGERPR